ncbi:hypothetical protein K474DRAFT_1220202 [Panus rudis PR-1116 ss-1]|nr:hypothetical protein K474DRAFT_1220202 [Panus rudis PR-1116 ss-1]
MSLSRLVIIVPVSHSTSISGARGDDSTRRHRDINEERRVTWRPGFSRYPGTERLCSRRFVTMFFCSMPRVECSRTLQDWLLNIAIVGRPHSAALSDRILVGWSRAQPFPRTPPPQGTQGTRPSSGSTR